MAVVGGAPLISGLVFDGTGAPYAGTTLGDRGSLMISGGSATVADNRFLNGGEVMVGLDANAVIESNEFIDGPHLYLQDPGDDAIVRGNTFSGSFDRAMGLFGASTMTIEGNTVDGAGGDGITIGWYASPGHDPLIRDNDISGTQVGIMAFAETDPIVESNRFRDNATAIYNQSDTGTYTGNELAGNDFGIYTRGAPVLEGNSIVDGGVGIRLFGTDTTKPVMKGNTVCDNERNVSTPELGDVPPLEYEESNEICEDPPTE
jgi:nitrous oxidase accessory protein NosD